MSDVAIDVQGLTKRFDNDLAVDHISLSVNKGAIFGFLGANGSGKTTTIRMLCGLLTPTEGQGFCLGYDIISERYEIKKNTGYMPQKFSFYTGLTVYENLRFVADIFQVSSPQDAIDEIIHDLNFEHYRNTRVANLSGGWKQRLSLACSLLHHPQLLILDEPTAGIDPKSRKEFWDYLHNLSREKGTTILVSTHYMDEAERCTHLGYIYLGKLLYTGDTKHLIEASEVKTYILEGHHSEQALLIKQIHETYPSLLTSMVHNDLRISSKDHDAITRFIKQHHRLTFKDVQPSFEEVFIGLIQ